MGHSVAVPWTRQRRVPTYHHNLPSKADLNTACLGLPTQTNPTSTADKPSHIPTFKPAPITTSPQKRTSAPPASASPRGPTPPPPQTLASSESVSVRESVS
ncbi:MAG: hypothetical protein HY863_06430 [Chloroflexi bacterium]|nr:hypothetical protein [Chloroflexota bacterium]